MHIKTLDVLLKLYKSLETNLLLKQKELKSLLAELNDKKLHIAQSLSSQRRISLAFYDYRERLRAEVKKIEIKETLIKEQMNALQKQVTENYIEGKKCKLVREKLQNKLLLSLNAEEELNLEECAVRKVLTQNF
jgi:hypothetical protein